MKIQLITLSSYIISEYYNFECVSHVASLYLGIFSFGHGKKMQYLVVAEGKADN